MTSFRIDPGYDTLIQNVPSSGDLEVTPQNKAESKGNEVNYVPLSGLVFAFWYNIIAIPVAMLGLLNPFIAVFAMVGSSLTVTGNALRMSRKKL